MNKEKLKLGTKLNSNDKKNLFKEGILKNKCSVCNIDSIWNNQPIQMQIDHINGNNEDNRIDNLRAICPNCHSQTKTYGGRNKGKVCKIFPNKEFKTAVFYMDGKRMGELTNLYFNKN